MRVNRQDIQRAIDVIHKMQMDEHLKRRHFVLDAVRAWIDDSVFRRNVIKLLKEKKIRIKRSKKDYESDLLSYGIDLAAKKSDKSVIHFHKWEKL